MEHASAIITIGIALFIMLNIVYATIKTGISPMPSSLIASQNALTLLPDKHSGHIIDLGSGWGNVAAHFARANPNIQVTGIELSWLPYLFSKIRYRHPNIQFVRQDLYNVSPPPNSVLFCYLYPEAMDRISKHEAFSSCWILSNTFVCPNRKLLYESIPSGIYRDQVFLYAPNNSV